MSGTGNVLPMVAVAQSAATKSKAVHSKMVSQTGNNPSGMKSQDPSAQDGNAIAPNRGKESMETNLEGRVHTVDSRKGEEPNKAEGGQVAPEMNFNEVLNQKLAGKAENADPESERQFQGDAQASDEFILNPFVHAPVVQQAETGQGLGANVNSKQNADSQTLLQQQAAGQGQNVVNEGVNLKAEGAIEDSKLQFQPVTADSAENQTQIVSEENPAGKQQTAPEVQGTAETAVPTKETAVPAKETAVPAKETAAGMQNADKPASEQGIAPELKEGSLKGTAIKEVITPNVPEKVLKEAETAVQGQKDPVQNAQGQVKQVMSQEAGNFKQSEQSLGENAGQSESKESGNAGLQIEKSDIKAEKTDVSTGTFEVPVSDISSSDQKMVGGGFDIVEQGAQATASTSANAVRASENAGNVGMENPIAAKPIDQIIQQLNANYSSTDQQIRLTLTPEDLGTVRITFRQVEGEIVGMVEVQKEQTRREVEEAIPQLVSAMQNNGVQVRKVEVLQWNNPDQQQTKDQTSDSFNLAQEREFAQQRSQGSPDSSGSGRGHSGQAQGETTGRGRIRVDEVIGSDQMYSQKGLNFLV